MRRGRRRRPTRAARAGVSIVENSRLPLVALPLRRISHREKVTPMPHAPAHRNQFPGTRAAWHGRRWVTRSDVTRGSARGFPPSHLCTLDGALGLGRGGFGSEVRCAAERSRAGTQPNLRCVAREAGSGADGSGIPASLPGAWVLVGFAAPPGLTTAKGLGALASVALLDCLSARAR